MANGDVVVAQCDCIDAQVFRPNVEVSRFVQHGKHVDGSFFLSLQAVSSQ